MNDETLRAMIEKLPPGDVAWSSEVWDVWFACFLALGRMAASQAALAIPPASAPDLRPGLEAPYAPDEGWLLYYADKDMPPELFSSSGATDAAIRRFDQQASAWSCHLFKREFSSVGPTARDDQARARALAVQPAPGEK